MFDDNNIDKMMKSILENAQEEVPAHVWEGVSAGLDKAAKSKTVVIWWRRAAIGAAAAAVIVAGLLFTRSGADQVTESIDPQNGDFIAVVEKSSYDDTTSTNGLTPPENILMAEVKTPKAIKPASYNKPSNIIQAQEDIISDITEEKEPEEVVKEKVEKKRKELQTALHVQDFDFAEETAKKRNTSIILSGITGTNSIHNGARANLMKRPTPVSGPAKTGITETSTNTTYGIPVSAGIGVKFDLNDRWSLGVGVNYSYLSRKFYGTYTKADENGMEISSTSSDIKNSQHFVGIPVNAYCNLISNKHISLYAYAGGTVEKCVSDKYDVLSTNIVHTEKTKGVQMSANLGIGAEFKLGQHLGLYVDPSLRYYFDCGQPKSIRTAQPLMLGFEMGLRVNL
jgi:hypothetical protein